MMIAGKKRWMTPAALVALVLPLAVQAELVDRVAAVVNNEVITLSEVEERTAPELARLNVPRAERAEAVEKLRKQALDALIGEKLLGSQVKELGIEVTAQEIDAGLEDVIRQNGMTQEQFDQELTRSGYSVSSYRDFMKSHMARMKLIQMKVRQKVKVTEEDLKAEYANYAKQGSTNFEVHARHILISVGAKASDAEVEKAKAKAEAVAAEAKKPGTDFAELAKKRGEGASAAEGGDLGFFRKGVMVPAFDQVAFNLKPGQVSAPVRSPLGFHIIKVEERRALGAEGFEEVKEQLRAEMYQSQMERYTEQYVKELRQAAAVEVKL